MLSAVQQSADILSFHDHQKGDLGSTELDGLIHGLADVDRVTEQSFLALGNQIQGSHGRAHGISQVAGDVLDLLHGEAGENTLQRLQLLVERCSIWLSETDKKSVEICTLLDKPANREVEIKVKYVGFEVPSVYIVGYGLDFEQKYRNLPYLAKMDSEQV